VRGSASGRPRPGCRQGQPRARGPIPYPPARPHSPFPPPRPQDLYVGGRLEVFNRAFELTNADEYTLTYMENNCHIFVMADVAAILDSLRGQVGGRRRQARGA
jgi:hypothetical protein